ncbi:MAG: hypothetical protein E3J88_03450 [Anaerolineales bacterium]|nr:MAG: hypothetical protein E3J88_03450 [Anaerolineales bacterium]
MLKPYKFWIHPISFGIFPVIYLLAHNVSEIHISASYRALGVSLLTAILLTVVYKRISKDWHKASLMASLCLVLFFSYGHIYNALLEAEIHSITHGVHRYLIPLWLLLFAFGARWIIRRSKEILSMTNALNMISIAALMMPIFQIISFEVQTFRAETQLLETDVGTETFQLPEGQQPPDIYYIILDAYARDDSLLADYGLDNTPFLDSLADEGFYIAPCSQSNYNTTHFSLATSLNMNYVEDLLKPEQMTGTKRTGLGHLIKHSFVRQTLENLGYKSIAFETGFIWTQIEDADIYLSQNQAALGGERLSKYVNEFELLLLKSSAALIIIDGTALLPNITPQDIDKTDNARRDLVLFVFEQLNSMPSVEGPKFVFAHIVSPHRPFVFAADGSTNINRNKTAAYAEQVTYINTQILSLVDNLMTNSEIPPIIILQGDHGGVALKVGSSRLKILNAYHLPQGGNEHLYPNISPVNSFRVIFNTYFNGNLPLLEDFGFYSTDNAPFDLIFVPESRPDCQQ